MTSTNLNSGHDRVLLEVLGFVLKCLVELGDVFERMSGNNTIVMVGCHEQSCWPLLSRLDFDVVKRGVPKKFENLINGYFLERFPIFLIFSRFFKFLENLHFPKNPKNLFLTCK